MRIGSKLVYGTQIGATSEGVGFNISMPVWLATGTYNVELMSSSAKSNKWLNFRVEFNIVQ